MVCLDFPFSVCNAITVEIMLVKYIYNSMRNNLNKYSHWMCSCFNEFIMMDLCLPMSVVKI